MCSPSQSASILTSVDNEGRGPPARAMPSIRWRTTSQMLRDTRRHPASLARLTTDGARRPFSFKLRVRGWTVERPTKRARRVRTAVGDLISFGDVPVAVSRVSTGRAAAPPPTPPPPPPPPGHSPAASSSCARLPRDSHELQRDEQASIVMIRRDGRIRVPDRACSETWRALRRVRLQQERGHRPARENAYGLGRGTIRFLSACGAP